MLYSFQISQNIIMIVIYYSQPLKKRLYVSKDQDLALVYNPALEH